MAGAAIAGGALIGPEAAAEAAEPGPETRALTLVVNGERRSIEVDTRASLLDTLREQLGLTGTKKGCNQGACGACTVHIDGRRALSCLALAAVHDQREITTIEGLADGDRLHPMQEAFVERDGFQCGFCTPGQIMSAVALLSERPDVPDADIPELMSGNLCRCAAYQNIHAAIRDVRGAS
jgi:xanthine dehydrogenase YagT iron-sulfur-binding subunit